MLKGRVSGDFVALGNDLLVALNTAFSCRHSEYISPGEDECM